MTKRKRFVLTLVRHGETEFNRRGLVQGQTSDTDDTALNDVGKAQARALGRWLSSETYTHVISSDQRRARETCEIILSENAVWKAGLNEIDITFDQRIRERNYGAMEGRTKEEYHATLKLMSKTSTNSVPEGAETIAELGQRADEFFTDLCQTCFHCVVRDGSEDLNSIPNVLVVSHGRLLTTLMTTFSEKYGCPFPPGRLGVVSVNTGRSCFVIEFTKHFQPNISSENNANGHKAISMKCTILGNGDHIDDGDDASGAKP